MDKRDQETTFEQRHVLQVAGVLNRMPDEGVCRASAICARLAVERALHAMRGAMLDTVISYCPAEALNKVLIALAEDVDVHYEKAWNLAGGKVE